MNHLLDGINECKASLEMLLFRLDQINVQLLSTALPTAGAANENNLNNQTVAKIINENKLDWRTILNNLKIISTNLTSILKSIKEKKELRTQMIVPKVCSDNLDNSLKDLTQNRMSVFNQDLIPNILRTKLIPQLEDNEKKVFEVSRELEQVKTFDVSRASTLKATASEFTF